MLATHVTYHLADDRVIVHTRGARLQLARAVLRVCRDVELVAFHCIANHLHLLVACERSEAGRIAHAVACAVKPSLVRKVDFAPARFIPVTEQRYLENSFAYVIDQPERHKVFLDPMREASNLPDLLGLRVNGLFTKGHVDALLPWVSDESLWKRYGGRPRPLDVVPLDLLVEASAAAVGFENLDGNLPEIVDARRAAIHVAWPAFPPSKIGPALGISAASVRRLAQVPGNPQVMNAIRLQLALRSRFRRRAQELGGASTAVVPG
jgi:hypothetical protein